MVLRGVAWCPVVSREKIGACGALSCVVSWLSCGEIDSEIDSDIDSKVDSSIDKEIACEIDSESETDSEIDIGGWGVRSQWNGDPPPGNRFRFRVRVVRAGEAKLRGRARGKCPSLAEARPDQMTGVRQMWARGVPPVSRCPALAEARPDQMTPFRRPWVRGVPPVSRRCPVGVPSVSR